MELMTLTLKKLVRIMTIQRYISIDNLLYNWRIVSVDLSRNNIGKTGALALSKTLKDNGGHIEWIE